MIALLFDMTLFALALTLERFMGWNRLTKMLRREKVGMEHKIRIIYNGVDTSKFHPNRRQSKEWFDELWDKHKED